jgi:hypothetical protein
MAFLFVSYDGQSLASLKAPSAHRLELRDSNRPGLGKNLIGFSLSVAGTCLVWLFSFYGEPVRRWLPSL